MVVNSMALSERNSPSKHKGTSLDPDRIHRRPAALTATVSPALECRFALFQECLDRFAMVLGTTGHSLAPCFAVEQLAKLVSNREVKIGLHVAVGDSRAVCDAPGGRVNVVAERGGWKKPIHQTDSQRFGRINHVGQKVEFARFGRADQSRQ